MRAIILAAGMGTRLRPLTNDVPKALVKVKDIPMIERQITFLQEKGIHEITVITGYLHEQFDYLIEKFDVQLVHNPMYDQYNNLYSMYLVRDLLAESYVLEGDVFLHHNIIDPDLTTSTYFCTPKNEPFESEWIVETNSSGKITNITVADGENTYILAGISYWNKKDGKQIAKHLEAYVESGQFENLYWDDAVIRHLDSFTVMQKCLQVTDTFEIDNVHDLRSVEKILIT